MDGRRIARLARVLVQSQLRAGRSTSDPTSFFGRPSMLLVLDAAVFLAVFGLSYPVLSAVAKSAPEILLPLTPQLLSFLPLVSLGVLLIAGVMFELTTTSRFSSSDAANWLPISPVEYVAASSLAASLSYSVTLSFVLGIGLGVAAVTGSLPLYALSAGLSVLALFLGGVLIEMLRSSTQRISSVVARRTGRATLVIRIALLLGVLLVFDLAFNPVVLFRVLEAYAGLGPIALAVPFLWPSQAILSAAAGNFLAALVLVLADLLFAAGLVLAAARLRVRFWSPVAPQLVLEAHIYAEPHRLLTLFGLTPAEASLTSKDLKGLVRRRELLPVLVTPAVIGIVTLVSSATSRAGGGAPAGVSIGILVAWVPGFFALFLACTSFAQERRALQLLYALPIAPRSVFRAKFATILFPSFLFGAVLWVVAAALLRPTVRLAVTLAGVDVAVILIGASLGLAFAARFSDFQERPRPQFLRPLPMVVVMLLGLGTMFAVGLPLFFWATGPAVADAASYLQLVGPAAVAALVASAGFALARSGTYALLREIPV